MTERLRVLQLIDGLNVGGAEVLLRDLVAGLRSRECMVQVGYSTPGPLLADFVQWAHTCGAPFPVQIQRKNRLDPRLFRQMSDLIRQFRPDIVHTHLFKSDFFGRMAARWCRVPVVISTLHNTDAWAQRWPLGSIHGLNARLADRLIAVSEDVAQYHQRYSHIPAARMVTIPNGVDVDKFTPNPEAASRLRAELGFEPYTPLVGIIGRLKPQKDHALFLQAAHQILLQAPETHFLVVGDGPLRPELEARARSLEIAPHVHFLGVRSDIPAVLSALDILAFSSRWEGLPVTLLEGMAAQRAVVATAVAGIREVVHHGEDALLTEPNNPTALASACLDLLGNPDRRQQLGSRALQTVQGSYSLEAMIDRVFALYCQLFDGHAGGGVA